MSFWFGGLSAAGRYGNFLHDHCYAYWIGARNLDQRIGNVCVAPDRNLAHCPADIDRVGDRRFHCLPMLLRPADSDDRRVHHDSLDAITRSKRANDAWLHRHLPREPCIEAEMDLTG